MSMQCSVAKSQFLSEIEIDIEKEEDKKEARELELASQEYFIHKHSCEKFLARMKEVQDLPPELKNMNFKLLCLLEEVGFDYNYNNIFYRHIPTGKVGMCQEGTGGREITRSNDYESFVVDHMLWSQYSSLREDFLNGWKRGGKEVSIQEIQDLGSQYDIYPDWVSIEKMKAQLRMLQSKQYALTEAGINLFVIHKQEAYEKYVKENQNYYDSPYKDFWPEMTYFFGPQNEGYRSLPSERN